jgi:glycosyltransferase involved in cell wall biosynthesis
VPDVSVPPNEPRPLRLCFVTFSGFPDQGATYAYEMSRSAAAAGHDVTAVAIARPGEPADAGVDGVRVLRLPAAVTTRWASPARWTSKLTFMRAAARIVRDGRFDVVHVYCTIGGALVPLLAGSGPLYVQEHQTGAVSAGSALVRGLEDRLRAWQGRFFDRDFTVSQELGERLFKGRRPFEVMPAGVNLRLFGGTAAATFRASHDIAPDDVVFVHAGVLEASRATDVPLRAFAQAFADHPSVRLLMPGKGAQLEELRRLARALGVADRVWLPGYVPYTDLPGVFAAADVGLSYLPQTPFYASGQPPMKVMEYLGAGLPVLATDLPSHRGLIRHEVNGLLAPAGVESYAAIMRRIVDDPALRARLAAAARPSVEAMTYDHIATDRLVPLYRRLLAGRRQDAA